MPDDKLITIRNLSSLSVRLYVEEREEIVLSDGTKRKTHNEKYPPVVIPARGSVTLKEKMWLAWCKDNADSHLLLTGQLVAA